MLTDRLLSHYILYYVSRTNPEEKSSISLFFFRPSNVLESALLSLFFYFPGFEKIIPVIPPAYDKIHKIGKDIAEQR